MTTLIDKQDISKKSKQDEESYIRRRDYLLKKIRNTNWDDEGEKPLRRRVVTYIKPKQKNR